MNKYTLKPVSLLLTGVALFSAATAQATTANEYLQLDGIKGTSVAKNHKDWSDVSNVSWSIAAEASWTKGAGAAVGRPIPSAVSWTQNLDITTPLLYQKILTGKSIPTAKFDFVPKPSAADAPYMSLGLKEVFLTHVGMNNSQVEASAVSKEMSWTYTPAALGGKAPPSTVTWDITKGTVSGSSTRAADPGTVGIDSAANFGDTRAYLRLDTIAGDSKTRGYENWINVGDVSWNVDAETSFLKGAGAAVGKAVPGSLSWTQGLEGSVLPELVNILKGTSVKNATLEFVSNFGNGPTTFMQMAMEDVFFTKISANDTNVTDEVVFKKYTQTVWGLNGDGSRGKGVSFGYDFSAGKPYAGETTPPRPGFGSGNLIPEANLISEPPMAAPVPEPETYGMMIAGLGMLAFIARRRHSASA